MRLIVSMPAFPPAVLALLCISLWETSTSTALASWTSDPALNTPIAVEANSQIDHEVTSSAGQLITTWRDNRTSGGSNHTIYAQALTETGTILWTTGGVALAPAVGSASAPFLVSDNGGGAYVVWSGTGTGFDIFAQRVDSNGNRLWGPSGVAVTSATGSQLFPQALRLSDGGILLAWADARSGNRDVYIQRLNASGAPLWTPGGVALLTGFGDQNLEGMVTDNADGAIITYSTNASGTHDVYAQRISPTGSALWAGLGTAIDTTPGNQFGSRAVPDGSGGAILIWEKTTINSGDLAAQRVNGSGTPLWTAGGVPIASTSGQQNGQVIASNGSGGAAFAWTDTRSGGRNVYVQTVDASGNALWLSDGVAVTSSVTTVANLDISYSATGVVTVAWNSLEGVNVPFVRTQRILPDAQAAWTAGGVSLSTASGQRTRPRTAIASNGDPILFWEDSRFADKDLFAQRLMGTSGELLPVTLRSFKID